MNPSPSDIVTIVVGVISVIAAALGGIVIYMLQKKKKELSYEIRVNDLWVDNSAFSTHVKVFYEGKEVENLRTVGVRFRNTGKVAIRADDFEGPLIITYGEDAEVLTAGVGSVVGEAVIDRKSADYPHGLAISPLLLNPTDEFDVAAILTKSDGNVTVYGRIADVTAIRRIDNRQFKITIYGKTPLTLLSISLGFSILSGLYSFAHSFGWIG